MQQQSIITAMAIDDEPMALEVIRQLSVKVPFLELQHCFTNALEALPYIQQHPPHLLFLDIKMPDISGLEFVKSLQHPPMVVFTTAYSEHAVQSFELDAIDYLLKPFSLSRFLKSCNKAYQLHKLRTQPLPDGNDPAPFIFIKSGYEQIKIILDDILYLQSAGNYVHFHLKTQKLLARLTLSEAEALLPEGKFIRIHRSYMVAASAIQKIDRTHVWMGNLPLPVGPGFITEIGQITGR